MNELVKYQREASEIKHFPDPVGKTKNIFETQITFKFILVF